MAGGANDSLHCPSVFYSRKIIEGTEVVQVSSDPTQNLHCKETRSFLLTEDPG